VRAERLLSVSSPALNFPSVTFRRAVESQSAEWSGLVELRPLVSRRVHQQWFHLFQDRIEGLSNDQWEWLGAGVLRTRPEYGAEATDLLRQAVGDTTRTSPSS